VDLENAKIELLEGLKNIDHPSLMATGISGFIVNAMRNGIINIYEGYLLNWEVVSYQRRSYLERGWKEGVRISICLAILNQRFLAQIFGNNEGAAQLKLWGLEAINLYKSKRAHYILDRYEEFLDAKDAPDLLKVLLDVRNNYQTLDFDKGPYHNEEFPYDFYVPEKILLENGQDYGKMIVNGIIEDLIVELNLK
jgi:hypothetical protein